MKKFCLINYNDYVCHPYFFYANDSESIYQYVFDNKLIDFDYVNVKCSDYTVEKIYDIIKNTEINPHANFRSIIYEVPAFKTTIIPEQKIRSTYDNTPTVMEYDDLDHSKKKDLDFTVQYVRNMELKKNAFDKLKELREIDERIANFYNNGKKIDV